MPTYKRPDKTVFVIVNHTLEEWASVRRDKLVALGCSAEYADKIAKGYLKAKPA